MLQLNLDPGLLAEFLLFVSADGLLMPDVYIYLSIGRPPSLGGQSARSIKPTLFIDAFQ